MKMRMEALKFNTKKQEEDVVEGGTQKQSAKEYALPYLQPFDANKQKTALMKKKHKKSPQKSVASQDKSIEKMSGSFDIDFSLGGFPNRCEVHHPTAMCLRCSQPASL